MKFSIVLFFVILSFNLFGQNGDKYYSINMNKEKLAIFKQNGDYSFQLLDNYTDEIVKTNSKYYSMYFSVEFDEVKKELKLKMITNDEQSRHVICRYFSALNINKINIDGKEYELENFYQLYLK